MKGFLTRHWRMITFAMTVGIAVAFVGLNAQTRYQATHLWSHLLAWTGFSETMSASDQVFWCPMHPQIKRNQPNEVCPICNMALVPLETNSTSENSDVLTLTPRQVQQAGVVSEPIRQRWLYREIDTTGRLDYDETRRIGISSWVSGKSRIEKLHVNFTGQRIKRGDLMVEIYNPELISSQEEFLVALKSTSGTNKTQSQTNRPSLPDFTVQLTNSSRQKLLYQGMKPSQIDELAKSGTVPDFIPIYAPASGTVIERHIQVGQYVKEGEWLFHMADLSRLWMFADVYEDELPLVQTGMRVRLTVKSLQGQTFDGTVAFIDPMVQPQTRTVRVRIDVNNSERLLKPGMYTRVQLRVHARQVMAVPEDAVLWSGRRTVVLVRQTEGTFQPKEVRLGQKWLHARTALQRDGNAKSLGFGQTEQRFHEVVTGLSAGDQVVTAGAFLLNAESQFQSVLAKMLPQESESLSLDDFLGKPLAAKLRAVFAANTSLSESLADDRLSFVSARATLLAKQATELAIEAEDAKESALADDARKLVDAATKLAKSSPTQLKQARIGFGSISRQFVGLLGRHGGKAMLNRELYLYECPMAGPFGYKLWVRPNQNMRNPYMGKVMLDCGKAIHSFDDDKAQTRKK